MYILVDDLNLLLLLIDSETDELLHWKQCRSIGHLESTIEVWMQMI
ncbi:hypothetical protein NRIC_37930 [Enterococcus florum]|uniref:Uncharacterized protein n=1 Tax=Enterococcus florum TaxID=2480627 RepID=A0A4P5PK01_9ENTE|nr:hypothetical protein NRIC_37930 [Enterococcus florum]